MGSAKSGQFGLPGNNRLWIELIWSESVSGTTNRVNMQMKVHTKYMIAGTWRCRIKADGSTLQERPVGMYWGSNSSGGSEIVCNVTKSFTYTGAKTLTIEGAIVDMDYYDIYLGPSSTVRKTLTFSTKVALRSTNVAPPTPSITCTNIYQNKRYLAEDTIDLTIGRVTDPNGDTVTYKAYAEYMPPGGNSWLNAGDSNKCIFSSTSNTVRHSITKYARGTQFRVWANAVDKYGAGSKSTSYIYSIYRNQTPNRVISITPNEGVFNNNFAINWSNPGDPDGTTPTFNLLLSKNNGAYQNVLTSSSATSYTQNINEDSEGTTYNYRISSTDGLTESPYTQSGVYRKNTKPTTPNQIFPNSGYALGNTNIIWNASTDPDGRGIDYYKVFINDSLIGTSKENRLTWYVPDADQPGRSYRASVQAVDIDGKLSDIGYATGPFFKAIPPNPPAWIKPNEDYFENHINLEWENVSSNGVSVSYTLQCRIDNATWASLASVKVPQYKHDITKINRGSKIEYRIMCSNSFGQTSGYKESKAYYRNRISQSPTINYPVNNSIIYDINPRIAITINDAFDNQTQVLYISCNGNTYNTKDNKDMFSKNTMEFVKGDKIIFFPPSLSAGPNKIAAYTNDGLVNSESFAINISINDTTSIVKQDDFILAQLFNDIKARIKNIRKAYGYGEYNYINSIGSGIAIKKDHLLELRNAIQDARLRMNSFDGVSTGDIEVLWSDITEPAIIYNKYMNEIISIINHV